MSYSPNARTVLILWNQVEDDVYEHLRERGATALPWAPEQYAAEVRTVREEMEDLVQSVRQAGYRVECVNVGDDLSLLLGSLRLFRPDVVFNLIEYFHDDADLEASVAGLYELFGYAYTGSRGYTLSLCQHKHHTKRVLADAGLATAPGFVLDALDTPLPPRDALADRFPLIVKPALEDASGGIEIDAVVSDYDALTARVRYVLSEFEQPALVEQYIDGREIHAAILGNEDPQVLPLFEMRFVDDERAERFEGPDGWRPRIVSYSGKWDPLSRDFYNLDPVCPARSIDRDIEDRLADVALRAYRATGCRDYARIDMRLGADGTPCILEVNPNPDLTDGSAFIMCAQASGRSYAQTLAEIIELAAARNAITNVTGDVTSDVAGDSASNLEEHDGDDREDEPTDHLSRKYWLLSRAERDVETAAESESER